MGMAREYEALDFSTAINDPTSPFSAAAGGIGEDATLVAGEVDQGAEINGGDPYVMLEFEYVDEYENANTRVFFDADVFAEMTGFVLEDYDGE